MHQETDRLRVFGRRALLVAGGQVALFGLLGYRLHQLQLQEGERYRLLAEDNRVSQRLLMPPRGRIVDRLGRRVAENTPVYRVRVVREQARDVRKTLKKLALLIPIADERIEEIVAESAVRRAFVPISVHEELTWDEVTLIAVHAPELPGILLESALVREYPQGPLFSHILGYVGPVNESEQDEDPDPLLQLPDLRIGKSGIERAYDHALRGSAGLSRIEVNAVGRQIRELSREDGADGQDLQLAVDSDLQRYCMDRLSTEIAAAAVVVEVDTGAVMALASVPSFEPSHFVNGLSHDVWARLRDDPLHPLVNRTIRGQYPPGSTFKMVTALAALEAGAISPAAEVFCPGHMSLGNARFHCWKQGGHGRLALVQALAQSCDVYFYEVARRVGVDAIAAMGKRFGLGEPTGIDLPGERPGLMPTRQWKLDNVGVPWQRGETLVVGIGQGFVLATPLQLAVMTARLCNGGRAVRPWFVRGSLSEVAGGTGGLAPPIDVSSDNLNWVLKGMDEVVNGRRGTARGAALDIPGVLMAGKTGTSQVRRITKTERASGAHKRKDKPREERHHALFVGYAPIDRPRYAVSVIVEHGDSGSKAAAPIARDIMAEALRIDPAQGLPIASRPALRSAG